uniref:Troponin T n=1 Tax=Parastrongyloides trichosuri TaxID=131310 RepID=A0A0N4Z0R7_PARTI
MLRLPCTRIEVKTSELDSLLKDLESYKEKYDAKHPGKRFGHNNSTPDMKTLLNIGAPTKEEAEQHALESKGPVTRSRKHALDTEKEA